MSTIVLIAGAGLGAWAWRRVTPALRAAGHDVHPLTLTGFGDRAHLATPGIDLSTWVTDGIAHLEAEELSDVVLVGHSFAGAVITGIAEEAGERIARLVFLDGMLLTDGRSPFDDSPPELVAMFEELAAAHDGWRLPFFTDEQLDLYHAGHGLSPEDRRWLRAHVEAQPIATYRQALALPRVTAAPPPRTYVRCLRTPGPSPVAPGEPGWQLEALDSGHWPMITKPQETAALLDAVARAA